MSYTSWSSRISHAFILIILMLGVSSIARADSFTFDVNGGPKGPQALTLDINRISGGFSYSFLLAGTNSLSGDSGTCTWRSCNISDPMFTGTGNLRGYTEWLAGSWTKGGSDWKDWGSFFSIKYACAVVPEESRLSDILCALGLFFALQIWTRRRTASARAV